VRKFERNKDSKMIIDLEVKSHREEERLIIERNLDSIYPDFIEQFYEGDIFVNWSTKPPLIGQTKHLITKIDKEGVWGCLLSNTVEKKLSFYLPTIGLKRVRRKIK